MDDLPGERILDSVVTLLPCPYLSVEVELTSERWAHILSGHPELTVDGLTRLAQTLADPDEIRGDPRFLRTKLFSRWFDDLLGGKIVVVALVTGEIVGSTLPRTWVVTAYVARRLSKGVVEWSRL